MTTPREWEAFAEETGKPDFPFHSISQSERALRMRSVPKAKMVTVRLIEDPEGDLLGWIYTGKNTVDMVQRKHIFPVQFVYGVEEEVKAGKGEVVTLRVEKIDNLYKDNL